MRYYSLVLFMCVSLRESCLEILPEDHEQVTELGQPEHSKTRNRNQKPEIMDSTELQTYNETLGQDYPTYGEEFKLLLTKCPNKHRRENKYLFLNKNEIDYVHAHHLSPN